MKKLTTIITSLFILLSICSLSFAQEAKYITLKNGSRLRGNVISFSDGIYTIQTDTLGEIELKEEAISSISSSDLEGSVPDITIQNSMKTQVQDIQGTLVNDPELMTEVEDVTQDPEVMEILNDENLIKDIMSYDPKRIENNPKIQKLMENPRMKELIGKVEERMEK